MTQKALITENRAAVDLEETQAPQNIVPPRRRASCRATGTRTGSRL
jgi:hypothetical protein